MPHDVTLISTIAVGFGLAFVFGFAATWLRLPPLVGYLLAGIVIGPFTPGFVADAALATQLAEIGVILLMFGVGLHFSVADLMAVRRLAVPGAVGQIALATLAGAGLALTWGWSIGAGLVLGLSLSVASTVVMLKALEERNGVATTNGRVAVGWLIVEDLAMVLVLVLLPAMGSGTAVDPAAPGANTAHATTAPGALGLLAAFGLTLAKVGLFAAVVLYFGPRIMPWLLRQAARTGSRELFTLAVLAVSVGIAFASAKLFGVSFALGAFFAGIVLNKSELSHRAAANSLPLQDAFAVLFFVSVGMLFDPSILVRHPAMVGAVVLLIVVGKTLIASVIVLALGYPVSTALTVSAALAQVGEFSFILAGMGVAQGLLPKEGLSLVMAGALISISLNPIAFAVSEKLLSLLRSRNRTRQILETARAPRLARLEQELAAVQARVEAEAALHKTFTPQELVERFPMFSGLNQEQREAVILHFENKSAQPGERIIRAGDDADVVFFIASGEVEVSVGERRIKLASGSFFGEIALISGQPRSADVTALDYCQMLTLSRRDFREVLRRYPALRQTILGTAGERREMNLHPLEPETAPTPATPPHDPPKPNPPPHP